jgi:hypothetical protein
MPRKAKPKKTISGYFRKVFDERPEWLHQRSNNDILVRYRADHSLAEGADVGKSVKNTLANLKSTLRSDQRREVRRADRAKTGAIRPAGPARHASAGARLERLEELIDHSLSMARSLADEQFDDVVRHLRAARNKLVWRMGEPS